MYTDTHRILRTIFRNEILPQSRLSTFLMFPMLLYIVLPCATYKWHKSDNVRNSAEKSAIALKIEI